MVNNKVDSILYVEDEIGIQNDLAEILEDFCDTLYLASNGQEGLDLFQEKKCDIVITDIKMPIMDGLEMAQKINELDEESHIIFTTAFSEIDFFQKAIDLQVDGYILKPIMLDQLEKKLLSIIKNINTKKDLQEKEAMLIQQSKMASMDEMMANIAHQWKQPLTVLSMGGNNLQMDIELGELKEENVLTCIKESSKQIKYLSETMEEFRDFFKPSCESDQEFKIKDFISKTTNLVSAAFKDNFIEMIKDVDDNINSYGDSNQLAQAVLNILNNAKDALKNAENITDKLVFILSAKIDDSKVIINIKDNAGGIPENTIDKIFNPYFTTKHKSQGTGLGLYITHTIITRNLKGTIEAKNEEIEYNGKKYIGASFTITLPFRSDGV